jgi:DNA-binding NtrC family response regulator
MANRPQDRKTILVVDDEPEVRSSTALLLETLGFLTVQAEDARSAFAVLEENKTVDLLFTDMVLPGGVSGVDLAREVLAKHPDLKVLVTSGRPELVNQDEFSVISKPFRMAELANRIREELGEGTP